MKGFTVTNEHVFTTVFCEHCGHTIKIPVYCKNRFCPTCSIHRNRLIRFKLSTWMKTIQLRPYDSFKFLTLTIANDPDLKNQVTELIKSFRRLRQRAVWRKHVRGGACIIEVKPGKEGWHAHLHIVIESGFLPFAVLLEEWKAVSSGQGVYIKKIHGSQVVGYITKYLTKEQCTEAEQKKMTDILRGVRLFQPFGNWYGPIQAIKGLRFECPECGNSYWFFGNRNAWIRSTSHERYLDLIDSAAGPLNNYRRQLSLPVYGDTLLCNID